MKYIFLYLVVLTTPIFAQQSRFTRLTYTQMTNLASSKRLPHRIFYDKKSTGIDAKWFDTVKEGNLEEIKRMVTAGQNIEAKDTTSLGQTALGWAAFLGYLDIVQYLVSQGADIYATDRADVAHVLKAAILGGDIKVINYLFPLYKGNLNLNAQDERDGETALMVAVGNERVEAVKFLLAQGVDVNIISSQLKRNAFSYACAVSNKELIDLLVKAGAKNYQTGLTTCQ